MSDYLERLMGKAKSGDFWSDLPEAKNSAPPKPTETRAVRRDSFDISAWDQITDQVPALGEQVREAEEKHPTSPAAYEDLFNLLNQGDPRFHAMSDMVTEYLPQHAMAQQMFAADDFQWVRNETKYDDYLTALAMLSMEKQMDDAMTQVDEAIEEIEQAKQDLADALAAAQAFLDAGGQLEPGDGAGTPVGIVQGEGDGSAPGEQGIIERLQKAMDGLADAEAKGDAAGDEAGKQAALGATKAKEEIEQEQQQASSYGIEPGTLKRMNYDERRKLAARLNKNRLTRFANLIGAFRMSADAERRRKVTHAPAEVYDVELGNDLSRIVASQRNDLAIPELEDLFWLRYVKQELAQWVTKGPDKRGKGPIIVVCDESYSMASELDTEGNTREAWSKATSLALCDQAKRAKRDFIYIGFASRGEIWESRFEGGRYSHEQIIDFAEHFFAGGTHYETPLTRAMEIIGAYEKSGKPKPDVVFITDAECDVDDAFIEAWKDVKKRADVRCYGINIGGSGRYSAMDRLVDRCIQINQLNANPAAVTEMFRTI